MASTHWPLVVEWARAAIAAIQPEIDPSVAFHHVDGWRPLLEEPPHQFHRGFVVEGGGGQDGNWYGDRSYRDVVKQLVVTVGYHANLNRTSLEEQMGRDEEQIVSTMLHRDNAPSGVVHVEWVDSVIDRQPDGIDPDKYTNEIVFRITYRTIF